MSVTYRPAMVPVSDDRGEVPGAMVTVRLSECSEVMGLVIPPEGDSVDCWAGALAYVALERDLMEALAYAALEGAAGRSGTEVVS